MVDPSLAAFRLLELIALLFPVVALLLQLQHRVVDTEKLARQGLAAGLGLVMILAVSFVLVSVHLLGTNSLPLLLSLSLVTTSLLGLQLPVLIVFSSETFVESATSALSMVIDPARTRNRVPRLTEESDDGSQDGGTHEKDDNDEKNYHD